MGEKGGGGGRGGGGGASLDGYARELEGYTDGNPRYSYTKKQAAGSYFLGSETVRITEKADGTVAVVTRTYDVNPKYGLALAVESGSQRQLFRSTSSAARAANAFLKSRKDSRGSRVSALVRRAGRVLNARYAGTSTLSGKPFAAGTRIGYMGFGKNTLTIPMSEL